MTRRDDLVEVTIELGTLWTRAIRSYGHAKLSGVLQPIETTWHALSADGMECLVRKLSEPNAEGDPKVKAMDQQAKSGSNPFMPYDPNLFVADVSPTHVCLLNKFNVIRHHLLIVTKELIDQEELLDANDFAAMWACLVEVDGLAFYNSGPSAGASQRHRHIQAVPLPLAEIGPRLPVEALLAQSQPPGQVDTAAGLPFAHAMVRFERSWTSSPERAARETLRCYRDALDALGLASSPGEQPAPYNLLSTREWMLIIPRSRERSGSISINALGFAGSFFVRNDEEHRELQDRGPLAILTDVATPGAPAGD